MSVDLLPKLLSGSLKDQDCDSDNVLVNLPKHSTQKIDPIENSHSKTSWNNKTKAILLPIVIGATAITGADLMTGSVEAAEGAEETKKVLPSYGEAAGLTTAAAIGSKATKADPLKGLRRFGKEGAKNLLKGIFRFLAKMNKIKSHTYMSCVQ